MATLLKVSEHKKDQAQMVPAEADTKLLVEEEKMEQVLAAYEQCFARLIWSYKEKYWDRWT